MAEVIRELDTEETNNSNTYLLEPDNQVDRTHRVYNFILNNSPTNMWIIGKKLNMPHSTVYYIVRDLEFCKMIKTRIIVNDKNRTVKICYIPKKDIKKIKEVKNENYNS